MNQSSFSRTDLNLNIIIIIIIINTFGVRLTVVFNTIRIILFIFNTIRFLSFIA